MSFYRILRRMFSTTAAAIPKPNSARSITAICTEIYQERNLNRLVDKFKASSEHHRFRSNARIYAHTIRRLTNAKRFKAIEEILEDQKKYPNFSNEKFAARLIALYGNAGMPENAQKLFDEMPLRNVDRTVLSFNALLLAFLKSHKLDTVQKIFGEIPDELSIQLDLVSYNIMIKAFCEKGSFNSAVLLIDKMERKGVKPDVITFNTMLDYLYRKGRFEQAEHIWGVMVKKNIIPDIQSYNARLQGLALEKRTEDGAQLVEQLRKRGVKLDVFTFDALINGFVNEGNLEEAKRWYGELVESGVTVGKWMYETLVPFVCENGDVGYAFQVCKDIFKSRRIVSVELLQGVVDSLVKAAMMEEAGELVKLGKTNNYRLYKLKLPSED